jgi:hypothetical protein
MRLRKNRNPEAPIRSDGNVSNLRVRVSAPKMLRASELKKNNAVPIDFLDGYAAEIIQAASS